VPPAGDCDYFSKLVQATQVSKLPLSAYEQIGRVPEQGPKACRRRGEQDTEHGKTGAENPGMERVHRAFTDVESQAVDIVRGTFAGCHN